LYGEAHPKGGLDENEYDNDDDDDVDFPKGCSIEVQKQLQIAWPSPERPMCLHAATLGMDHPVTKEQMLWIAETPF
jgi:hypothetical protein